MSLLADISSKLSNKIRDPDWVRKATDNLRDLPGELDLPWDTTDLADQVAARIDEDADLVAETSEAAFLMIVTKLALGQDNAAYHEWLRTQATAAERAAARREAFAGVRAEAIRRRQRWEAMKELGKDVLEIAGKAAVPLLLGALGV